jgi:hypothetical protein
MLEPLLKHSELSSILDLPTFGSPLKNADFPQPAIFTGTMTPLKVQPMSIMEPNSILPMDLEQFQDSLAKIPHGLLALRLKNLSSLKLLNYTASVSWLLNSTGFSVWPGLLFLLTDFP